MATGSPSSIIETRKLKVSQEYIGTGRSLGSLGSLGSCPHPPPPPHKVFSLCHAHSVCPVVKINFIKNCAPPPNQKVFPTPQGMSLIHMYINIMTSLLQEVTLTLWCSSVVKEYISTKSSKIAIHKNLDPRKFSTMQYNFTNLLHVHTACHKFSLKYFHERLKICEICKIKDPCEFSAIQYMYVYVHVHVPNRIQYIPNIL